VPPEIRPHAHSGCIRGPAAGRLQPLGRCRRLSAGLSARCVSLTDRVGEALGRVAAGARCNGLFRLPPSPPPAPLAHSLRRPQAPSTGPPAPPARRHIPCSLRHSIPRSPVAHTRSIRPCSRPSAAPFFECNLFTYEICRISFIMR
jgi:hypothetical protein